MRIYYNRNTTEDLYLVEGVLSHIHREQNIVDINELTMPGSGLLNQLAIVAGSMGGQAGLASSGLSAMTNNLARADNIRCQINGQVYTGTLTGARLLQEGDRVRAVVSKRDEGLYVHAIQRPRDGLLWLPLLSYLGRRAMSRFYLKLSGLFLVLGWILLFSTFYYLNGKQASPEFRIFTYKLAAYIPIGLAAFVQLSLGWVYRPFCIRAEKIFRALGFPKVKSLNFLYANFLLFHHDVFQIEMHQKFPDYRTVYYYQPALDAHIAGTKIQREQLPLPKDAIDPPDPLDELRKMGEQNLQKINDMMQQHEQISSGRKNK